MKNENMKIDTVLYSLRLFNSYFFNSSAANNSLFKDLSLVKAMVHQISFFLLQVVRDLFLVFWIVYVQLCKLVRGGIDVPTVPKLKKQFK